MRQFVYTVYLPGQKKTVQIKELYFNRYKHLVKNITNDNDEIIASFFDSLLADLCQEGENVLNYSFLDKLIILLTVRSVCISPEIELTGTCPETKSNFNFVVKISDMIQKLQNLDLPEDVFAVTKTYSDGSLVIELGMPNILSIKAVDLTILDTVIRKIKLNGEDITSTKDQIIDHLPAGVLKDINDYINYFSNKLSDISLLTVQSPFASVGKAIEIPLNLFSNSIIEFLKICFKRSLMSLYELEYFFLNRLNIEYELVKNSTPAELTIYINLFREEKKEEEKTRKSGKTLNPLQV